MVKLHITRRPRSRFLQLRVPLPVDIQAATGRKEFTKSLGTEDRVEAERAALKQLVKLHDEWEAIRAGQATHAVSGRPSDFDLQRLLADAYDKAVGTLDRNRKEVFLDDPDGFERYLRQQETSLILAGRGVDAGALERWVTPAVRVVEKAGYQAEPQSEWFAAFVRDLAEVTLAAVHTHNRRDRGDRGAKPSSEVLQRAVTMTRNPHSSRVPELEFLALCDLYMTQWMASKQSIRGTNTEQQKRATFSLFAGFWGNQPIRAVVGADAARFHDAVKLLNPDWARSPTGRSMTWNELHGVYGGHPKGLSVQTMNRHMRCLQSLWDWAKVRAHCEGDNPFVGFARKPKMGVNTSPYMPWELDELTALMGRPPARRDLLEVMIVALYSGMRLDEICSLRWGDIRLHGKGDGAVPYFNVREAKTPAGVRQVPVHPALSWLTMRSRGGADDRVWPKFNDEGPGKKPGADAGRAFSNYKIKLGFESRQKTFHSFRKNVTQIMERAGVRESDWAQVIGHERGFTYGTYNPDGITMEQKARLIGLVDYGDLQIPDLSL